ncbi:MAG: DUF4919 domain-containing protein [Prosthecobacter sp.]
MKSTLLLCLSILSATFSVAAEPPPAPDSKAVAAFTEMRMKHAEQPGFAGGWQHESERDKVVEAYDEDKPQPFLDASEPWLRKCPVDARVQLMRSNLLMKTGDVEGYFRHRMVYYGLMTSIVSSGDGRTPGTAYKVIAVDEEYQLLNHLGAKLKKQTLVDGPCDAMEVELDGKEVTIYFDVSISMEATRKLFEKAEKKNKDKKA